MCGGGVDEAVEEAGAAVCTRSGDVCRSAGGEVGGVEDLRIGVVFAGVHFGRCRVFEEQR